MHAELRSCVNEDMRSKIGQECSYRFCHAERKAAVIPPKPPRRQERHHLFMVATFGYQLSAIGYRLSTSPNKGAL